MSRTLATLFMVSLLLPSSWAHARRGGSGVAKAAPSGAAPQTSADPREQARKLVVQGAAEIKRGDYVKALAQFSQAYALYPSPKILFNMAQTYKELGRLVEALDGYERFLRTARKRTSRGLLKVARGKVQALKGQVATLLVQVSEPGAMIRIDGAEVGLSPMDIPYRVLPGRHLLVVSKKDFVTQTASVSLRHGQRLAHAVKLKKRRTRVVVRKEVYRIRRLPRKGLAVFWTGVGATLASGLGILVAGALTKTQERILDDESESVVHRLDAARRGKTLQWVTEGFIIGTGVLAIFTTVWGLTVVRRSGGTERVPVKEPTVTIAPSGPGILVRGIF